MSDALDRLKREYHWPAVKPHRDRNDFGWLSGANKRVLRRNLHRRTRLVAEIGSFMGSSANFIVRRARGATLVCIDPWRDAGEELARKYGLPPICLEREGLYETFLVNLWRHRERVVPMRKRSREAIPELAAAGLSPDVFYVDGSHEYDAVADDLRLIQTHHPRATIVGDDYSGDWPGVVRAVDEFCTTHGYRLMLDKRTWSIVR